MYGLTKERRTTSMSAWTNARMIVYGFLIGTAGVSILASKEGIHTCDCNLQAGWDIRNEDPDTDKRDL